MPHPPVVPPLTHSMWWVEQISGKFSPIELYLICCIFLAIWLNHTYDLKDFCSIWNLDRQAEKMACGSWKLSLKELKEGYIWYAKKVIQTHLQRCTADIWFTISVILLLIFIEWYIANLTELLRFLNFNQFTKISQRNYKGLIVKHKTENTRNIYGMLYLCCEEKANLVWEN